MANNSNAPKSDREINTGIGSGVGGILGGILGGGAAAGDFSNAKDAADRAYQELLQIGMPPDESKALVLQKFSQAGVLSPQLEQYIQAGPAETISEDPALRSKQMAAVNLLQHAATTGKTAQSQADLNEIQQQVARDQAAKMAQIQQQMQMRGMGGSGAELASLIAEQQGGANREADASLKAAANAQNAQMAALNQLSGASGQMRQQDLAANSTNANIKNEMNRFNTQNQIGQQARNVGTQNQAQQYNLSNAQNISNANAQQANAETQRQSDARRQYWNDQVARAKLRSGAYSGQSEEFQKRGQRTTDQAGAIGGAIGAIGGLAFNQGGMVPMVFNHGGVVPGQASVEGDHPLNDKVPALLSPGELVVPREAMQAQNPSLAVKKFVDYFMEKNKKGTN